MEKVEISQEQAVAHLAALLAGSGNLELRVAFVGSHKLCVAELVAKETHDVIRLRDANFDGELTPVTKDNSQIDLADPILLEPWINVWNELLFIHDPRYFLVHTPLNVHEEEAIRKALRKKAA